jgi:diguanylate cyclase (GGDEF)-like protein
MSDSNVSDLFPNARPKRVLVAGCSPAVVEQLTRELGSDVKVFDIGKDDTLSRELVHSTDLILLDFTDNETVPLRIAQFVSDATSHAMVFIMGAAQPGPEVMALVPDARPLGDPPDFSFLRGLLESAQYERERLRRLEEERSRIRLLYDISSALLKVTSHRHISKALEDSLPRLLDARLILLSFPKRTAPVGYFYTGEGVSEAKVRALIAHLEGAWNVLRADSPVRWDWVFSLCNGRAGVSDHRIRPTSFASAPISHGNTTEGFLTYLPLKEGNTDESCLQTFFLIGDLLSVLVHNLHLSEQLEQRATHDGLTQLLNRQTIIEALERECRRSQRYQSPVSIVMMDLDHFKQVNDRHGHQAGDEVLRAVSGVIKSSIREMDLAGRCGGEEFIVILPNTELEGASIWAERLRAKLEATPVEHLGKTLKFTASLGVASATGTFAITDHLIARADASLYDAKRSGRNRVVIAPPP